MAPDTETAREVWANRRPVPRTEPYGRKRGLFLRLGRCLRKGAFNRHLIAEKLVDGIQWSLHSTKGWRRRVA